MWILGHSFVFWARKRAASRTYSENLGLDPSAFSIHWFGRRGMLWGDLIFELSRLYTLFSPPDILIVHLGGNDVGKLRTLDLINMMKDDFNFLSQASPASCLIFSEIIPRLCWSDV